MTRAKSPQQKKEESYAHDQVEGGEYPHADRKNRPRVKAFGQRELRHRAKQILASQPEETLQLPTKPRWRWGKSGVRLPEHLESTRHQRLAREAHNIFRKGYSRATHARFRHVIQSWIQSNSQPIAEFYHGVLNRFPDEPVYGNSMTQRRDFLRQFFASEPDLRGSFEHWISVTRTPKAVDLGPTSLT
jgi:hypothetical protein